MVDVSGFITFMEDYSKRNDREIEIQLNTDWNKDKGIYIYIFLILMKMMKKTIFSIVKSQKKVIILVV